MYREEKEEISLMPVSRSGKRRGRSRSSRLILSISAVATAIATLAVFLYSQNNWLQLTRIPVELSQLPPAFDGYRIIHLSDLHGKGFGKEQQRLLKLVAAERPDLIVFTGDLTDSGTADEQKRSLQLMRGLVDLAPVYLITGNHDQTVGGFEPLQSDLEKAGVFVLRNEAVLLPRGGDVIRLSGIDDPQFDAYVGAKTSVRENLAEAQQEVPPARFNLLLAHRPELIAEYANAGYDLILAGHAHGGQVRLPFIGGLVAPGQGLNPRYTAGAYAEFGATMIVSRGLGNSIIPQRLFNRPQVIAITLRRAAAAD